MHRHALHTSITPIYSPNSGAWSGFILNQYETIRSTSIDYPRAIGNPNETVTMTRNSISVVYSFSEVLTGNTSDQINIQPVRESITKSSTTTIEVTTMLKGHSGYVSDGSADILRQTTINDAGGIQFTEGSQALVGGVADVYDKIGKSIQQQGQGSLNPVGGFTTVTSLINGSIGEFSSVISYLSQLHSQGYSLGESRIHYKAVGTIDNNGNVKVSSEKYFPSGF